MEAYREKMGEIVDELPRLEARAAFISLACASLGMMPEMDFDAFCTRKAWEGLYYITQDLEDKLRELNQKAR